MSDETTPTLPSLTWKTSYRHEDGDLIALFYIPALECALRYDRMTGYFSADALALAGRGIERLIANDGAMRLIVGCTLDEAEVQAIEQGSVLPSWSFAFFPSARRTGSQIALLAIETPGATRGHRGKWIMS